MPEIAVEILPAGIYDDFSEGGITLAFNAGVQKQIEDTLAQKCNKDAYTTEYQQALASILHPTDITIYTKRFIFGAFYLAAFIVAVVGGLMYQVYTIANEHVPTNIELNNKDLAQLKTMSEASSFTAIGLGQESLGFPTLTVQTTATSTSS